jgi:cobalt/nickel transport protein
MRKFLIAGLFVALLLAGVVSSFASGSPDGLDYAAREGCTFGADGEITGGTCMAQREQDHQLADSPLADYGIKGVDDERLSTGLSGVAGVLLTFALGGGLFWLIRRRSPDAAAPGDAPTDPSSDSAADSPSDSPTDEKVS